MFTATSRKIQSAVCMILSAVIVTPACRSVPSPPNALPTTVTR